MASIKPVFLMLFIVGSQLSQADSQFSVLATGQVQIIKLLEEITTTSTPLVPNITALLAKQEVLLENSTTVLNEINTAVRQIAAAQTSMAESLNLIVTLLQSRQNEDVSPQSGVTESPQPEEDVSPQSVQTTKTIPMPTFEPTTLTEIIPTDCSNISIADNHGSGVYTIDPRDGDGSFDVYCNMDIDEGGWTVFQKRFNGSIDFFLGWDDYENGFGNLQGEHWLGLRQMHRLTSSGQWTLRIDLESVYMDFGIVQIEANIGYAQYEDFQIGDAESFYRLSFENFTGNIHDSLTYHNGKRFSTKDQDHDGNSGNCASLNRGAWWYYNCLRSNLNGDYSTSMHWYYFATQGYSLLNKSEMKMRRTQ